MKPTVVGKWAYFSKHNAESMPKQGLEEIDNNSIIYRDYLFNFWWRVWRGVTQSVRFLACSFFLITECIRKFYPKKFFRPAPLYWRCWKLRVRNSNRWVESYRQIGCSRKTLTHIKIRFVYDTWSNLINKNSLTPKDQAAGGSVKGALRWKWFQWKIMARLCL